VRPRSSALLGSFSPSPQSFQYQQQQQQQQGSSEQGSFVPSYVVTVSAPPLAACISKRSPKCHTTNLCFLAYAMLGTISLSGSCLALYGTNLLKGIPRKMRLQQFVRGQLVHLFPRRRGIATPPSFPFLYDALRSRLFEPLFRRRAQSCHQTLLEGGGEKIAFISGSIVVVRHTLLWKLLFSFFPSFVMSEREKKR